MADQETTTPKVEPERSAYLVSSYASTVLFVPSPWDLKMIFGDTVSDLASGQNMNRQHTAITLSWQQAKTMLLFLRVNIELHEKEYGEIKIPKVAFSSALQQKISESSITMEGAISLISEALAEAARSSEQK